MQIQLPFSLCRRALGAPTARRSVGSYQVVPQSIVQTRQDHPADYVNAMGRVLSRGISQAVGCPFFFALRQSFNARQRDRIFLHVAYFSHRHTKMLKDKPNSYLRLFCDKANTNLS